MKIILVLALCLQLYAEVTTTQVVHTTRVETREDKSEVVSLYTSEVIQNDSAKIVIPKEIPTDYTNVWKIIFTISAISLAFI